MDAIPGQGFDMPFPGIIVFLDGHPDQGEQMSHLDHYLGLLGSDGSGTRQVISLGTDVDGDRLVTLYCRRIGIITENILHLIGKRHLATVP